MADVLEESQISFSIGLPGGLSQSELDALCVPSDEENPESTQDFDALLLRTKRTRHLLGTEAADALILNGMGQEKAAIDDDTTVEVKSVPLRGLSQDQLDALSVNASEEVSKPFPSQGSEEFLFRVRRTRRFLGDEAADALILDAMSKMPDVCSLEAEASDELATTASGSLSPPIGGLSQAELDAFSVSADLESDQTCSGDEPGELCFQARRRRHFLGGEQADTFICEEMSKMPVVLNQDEYGTVATGGLSQEELDSLASCAEDDGEPFSPEGSDAFLLRVKRARHFIGDEVAQALVSVTASNLDKHDTDVANGLSQEELDTLAVNSAEKVGEPREPEKGSEAFLLRVRRARHFMGNEAADALVSEVMSKSLNAVCKVDDDDADGSMSTKSTKSTKSGAETSVGDSLSLPPFSAQVSLAAVSQAMLDDMCVSESEELCQATASSSTVSSARAPSVRVFSPTASSKVRSKVQGLSIETDDLAVRLEKVASPMRNLWSPSRGSPTRSPTRSLLPSSPQHALTEV